MQTGRGTRRRGYGRRLVGVDEQQVGQRPASGLSWGSRPDQLPHQDAEIVPSDVNQVALVDIFASAQPSPAHATTVEIMGEGSLDDPISHRINQNRLRQRAAK